MDILITGGTGALGHALTRHLLDESDAQRICIYSRDEHKQFLMRQRFGDDGRLRWFVGDVRDKCRLVRAMKSVDVVIHAAALKRIEVGNYNPCEMIKTNVGGAMNVTEGAADAGVSKVLLVSTDKAYQPVSPYGQSKALAESLFLASNETHGSGGPAYSVVRYGNVAGSTGSVIPIWRELLAEGETILPVTDPDCTRFWMRMDEAVRLVADTLETMQGGELNIPDLPAYRLGDLVTALGARMQVIGLPTWEKQHESMDETRCSLTARRMSVDELRDALWSV